LARATQLDAASAGKLSIAELREAARIAGIAPEAFEQALSELHTGDTVADAKRGQRRRRRYWVAGVVLAAALLLAVLIMLRVSVNPPHVL
jgi:hypothetical protein